MVGTADEAADAAAGLAQTVAGGEDEAEEVPAGEPAAADDHDYGGHDEDQTQRDLLPVQQEILHLDLFICLSLQKYLPYYKSSNIS